MGVGKIVVGDPAVAIDAPVGGPGVTDEELVGLVIVPNSHHSVAAEVGFGGLGHGDEAAGGGDGSFEAFVDGQAEDEGDAGSEAAFEGSDVGVIEVSGIGDAEFVSLDEALLRGDVREALGVIGPQGLRTAAEFLGDGGGELEARSEVRLNRPELRPFIPVNVQPGRHDQLLSGALEVDLDGCCDRVGRAAAQLALIVDRRTIRL